MTNGDLPGVLVDVVEFDVGAATVDMARGITGTCERLSVKSFPWGPSGSYGQVLVSRSSASVDCHFSRHVAMNQQPCCESKLDFPLPLRVPRCLRLWGPFGASRNGHGSRHGRGCCWRHFLLATAKSRRKGPALTGHLARAQPFRQLASQISSQRIPEI